MSQRTKLDKYKPRSNAIRYCLGYLALFLGTILTKVTVTGRQHIPKKGSFIIAANHFNRLDPPFVVYALRRPINFLMASDQKVEPYLMWAPWLYGFIPTNRTSIVPSTIKLALKVLKRGEILGIFPEGTSTNTVLRPAKNGVVYFSTVTAAEILPLSITGLEDVWRKWFSGVRPRIHIRIGKPFGPYSLPKEKQLREAALNKIGIEVMCRIAALLPEDRHGTFVANQKIKDYRFENR